MSTHNLFNLAGLLVALTVLGVALIVWPALLWNPSFIISVALFALAAGYLISAFQIIPMGRGNASAIASIGPLFLLRVFLLIATGAASVAAFYGRDSVSWALDLFAVGGLIAGSLILKGALRVVDQIAFGEDKRSAHGKWMVRLQDLASESTDPKVIRMLEALVETARFAGRDLESLPPEVNDNIMRHIETLSKAIGSPDVDAIEREIQKIKTLIAQRENTLKLQRSQI